MIKRIVNNMVDVAGAVYSNALITMIEDMRVVTNINVPIAELKIDLLFLFNSDNPNSLEVNVEKL
jgi:hypothetical protein